MNELVQTRSLVAGQKDLTISENSGFVWEILNCFHGDIPFRILGEMEEGRCGLLE